MKTLILADLHIHRYPQFGYERLRMLNEFFKWFLEQVNFHKVDQVIVAGDYWHSRSSIGVEPLLLGFEFIHNLTKIVPVTILAGQHDQLDQVGEVSSLQVFAHKTQVVLQPKTLVSKVDKNVYFHFVPYNPFVQTVDQTIERMASKAQSGKGLHFLIGHLSVIGGKMGPSDYLSQEGVPLKALRAEDFDYVFLGDYHTPQKLSKNVVYVGSPIQQNFGECEQRKRVILLHTTRDGRFSVKSIPVPVEIGGFKVISEDEINTSDVENQFVRVEISDQDQVATVRRTLLKRGALGVDVIGVGDTSDVNLSEEEIGISADLSTDEIVIEYLKIVPPNGEIDGEYLDFVRRSSFYSGFLEEVSQGYKEGSSSNED